MRVAIVGGGVSGLAAAYFLTKARPGAIQATVLEASHHWGGLLWTEREGQWLFEKGPDSFIKHKPEALELCRSLGLEAELMAARADQTGAWVAYSGELFRFPTGFLTRAPVDRRQLLESPLLGPAGRRQVEREASVPAGDSPDESVASFVRRRLGEEVLDRFVQPLMAGVYGGDAGRLSVRSCLPRLYEWEQRHGCVTSHLRPDPVEPGGASGFLTLRGGIQRLPEALVEALRKRAELLTGWRTVSISRGRGNRFELRSDQGSSLSADAVVLAAPTFAAADLLEVSPELAGVLREIRYAPCVIASLAYDSDVTAGRTGSGVLVPPSQRTCLNACTWVHHKFEGRCPGGTSLLRAFVGGERAEEALSRPDSWIRERVTRDLARILGIQQLPRDFRIYRWGQGLPQYEPGHWQRVERIRSAASQIPGLYLAGNYFDGVGISDSIRHARSAAEAIARGAVPASD